MLRTPLHQNHLDLGGKIVDFAGWALPIQYRSQKAEHLAVREKAGVFDVSHMSPIDITGPEAEKYLQKLLANDVAKLPDGKALYSCMCNAEGGVIDDLIVYRFEDNNYRIVVNASTRQADTAWLEDHAKPFDITLTPDFDGAIIAIQGPSAIDIAKSLNLPIPQGRFEVTQDGEQIVARTGYTGEDGIEVMLPAEQAVKLWQSVIEAGAEPCGLGARDTLRLEAGMALYGQDLDLDHSPLESGLGWTVDLSDPDRDFIGRTVIEKQKNSGEHLRMIGLELEDRGVMRGHEKLFLEDGAQPVGQTTSAGFSPSTGKSIALARVSEVTARYQIEIRGKKLNTRKVRYPFVNHT